ncbi:hypothetical protein [Klebsiella pneumoniae]|uniref:hypothetical protein n=1 Tax=Klebsiella pneumoniae TaxID=573 RepID=UPI00287B95F9|nr:hypothetical protein [Klebsiella pneumoniae]
MAKTANQLIKEAYEIARDMPPAQGTLVKEQPRKKVDRCDVCTEGARGGCGTCIFNGNFE